MYKSYLFLIAFIAFSLELYTQELNCKIQIESPQIQSSDKQVFHTLEQAITEFMNNRKWTNDVFQNHERIECTLVINITDWDKVDDYRATVTIQSSRPVYNTSYNSTMLNFVDDDWQFRYEPSQPMDFTMTDHLSNLTSLLSYYAYLIIGMDYDSFSEEGGTTYYQKAQTIVENAQNDAVSGWKPYENSRNRYWIIESLLTPDFKPLRKLMYSYHRNGFDIMNKDIERARKVILEGIKGLKSVHQKQPSSFLMQIFFNSKSSEIIDLYSKALPQQRIEVFNVLNDVDAANALKYNKLKK